MSQKIVQRKVYFFVFAALMVLLFATTGFAYIDLGPLSPVIALFIAACKALLVILYFMHVRYSSRLTWIFAGAGVTWLMILIGLTLSDFISRGLLSIPGK
ncbi:MAG: cytochrome C oxidase subunit IV family protein [Ignavibacteriales bacterium]